MALISILLPKLGESVAEATIIKWLKQVGDKVEIDETIAEVGTDKVDTDLPSEYEGTIAQLLIKEGEVVDVGAPIAIIEVVGNRSSIIKETPDNESSGRGESNSVIKTNLSQAYTPQKSKNRISIKEQGKTGLFLTPVVRNIAKEAELTPEDLAKIVPTGSNNTRITKKDILNYLSPTTKAVAPTSKKRVLKKTPNDEILPLNRMRKLIASHLSESVQTAAHVTSWVTSDVSKIVDWRESKKVEFQKKHDTKLTYTHILMALVIESLKNYPKLNAWFDGEGELVIKGDINLGFAAATPDDNLIVPNIKLTQSKSFIDMVKEINTLGNAAKTKQLKSADIEDTTFTVSNTGIFGSMMGTPILALPQVAILALGEIASTPGIVIKDGIETIGIVKQMHLSLSYDHRVIDGAYASKFLKEDWRI